MPRFVDETSRAVELTVGAALAGAVALALVAGAAGVQERPDFSGTWLLNQDESDNPREKMRAGMRRGGGGMGGPGGGMGGRGGGVGGRGGGMGRPGGGMGGRGGGAGDPGAGMAGPGGPEAMERARKLVIRHQEPELHVIYGDERDETFYADGREVKRETARGEVVAKANWSDTRLVVERRTRRGKTTETYELALGAKRLYVTTRLESGRWGTVAIRRVYDAEEPEAATEPVVVEPPRP